MKTINLIITFFLITNTQVMCSQIIQQNFINIIAIKLKEHAYSLPLNTWQTFLKQIRQLTFFSIQIDLTCSIHFTKRYH